MMKQAEQKHNSRSSRELFVLKLILLTVLLLYGTATEAGADWRWQNVPRIVAIGDIHGAYDPLVRIFAELGLIDKDKNWTGGSTHLVSTGDLIDRGAESRKVMDLMMRLQQQARDAGGHVHVLLGNHELMNLTGDTRYVSTTEFRSYDDDKSAGLRQNAWHWFLAQRDEPHDDPALRAEFEATYPIGFFGHRRAFSIAGKYGAWLMQLPTMVIINENLFVHGGLPHWLGQYSIIDINTRMNRSLREFMAARETLVDSYTVPFDISTDDLLAYAGDASDERLAELGVAEQQAIGTIRELANSLLLQTDNPQWYRGTAACNALIELSALTDMLHGFHAHRVVIGHTRTPDSLVTSRFDGRVLMIDTGMLKQSDKGKASALILEDKKTNVHYLGASTASAPVPKQDRSITTGSGLSRAELETFLATADVISSTPIPDGITKPKKLQLRQRGIVLEAIFKSEDLYADRRNGRRNRYKDADSYRYDIAAYRIDQLLGLNMVPVTVPRTIGREKGAVQLWLNNSLNKREIIERGLHAVANCPLTRQFHLMYAFDYLISNDDRNQTNMLYTTPDWNLRLIDHSRAFRNRTGWPRYYSSEPELHLSRVFYERLASVSEDQVTQQLESVLQRSQIRYLIKRRDKLLTNFNKTNISTINAFLQ